MNAIRVSISLFIVLLIAIAIAGWRWAGAQPVHPSLWGRAALAGSVVAGIVGLVALWRDARSA